MAKIRTGFVSNSSSSSFIIAISETNKCPHCGRSDVDILDLVRRSSYYDNEVTAEGKEEVIKHLSEWYESDKYIKKIKDFDDKDKQIAMIEISYHDDVLNNLITESNNIEILFKE